MAPHVSLADPHVGIGFREFVALVAALMAMVSLAVDTMLPSLPAIGLAFGVKEESERQLVITALVLGLGGGQIIFGPISDGIGRRPVLIGATATYVVASSAAVLARSFDALLVIRLVQGLAVAGTRVATVSMVRDCYEGRQMARVMALAYMVYLSVPIAAPSVGQLILLFLPWRGIFGFLATFGLGVLAWLLVRVPETLHPEYRRRIDSGSVADAFRRTLRTRMSIGYTLAQMMLTGAMYGFTNSVEPIFVDEFHKPALMPVVFALTCSLMAIAALLNSRIVERLGTRRVSHAALIGFVIASAVHLWVVLAGCETIITFGVNLGVAMAFYALTMSNFGAMAMEPLAEIAGSAASVQGMLITVFGGLGGMAIGWVFDGTSLPMTIGFLTVGAIALAIVLGTEGGRLFVPRIGR